MLNCSALRRLLDPDIEVHEIGGGGIDHQAPAAVIVEVEIGALRSTAGKRLQRAL
jgi:hypothetical protein